MNRSTISFAGALLLSLSACGGNPARTDNTAEPAADVPIAFKATGHADGLDFTVTSVATATQIAGAVGGPKAEPGETFVIVGYTLKNTSQKPMTLLDRPGISLVDPKGQSLDSDAMLTGMASVTLSDPIGAASDLNPGVSAKTRAAWKVEKASFDKGTWRLSVSSDPRLTFALK